MIEDKIYTFPVNQEEEEVKEETSESEEDLEEGESDEWSDDVE